MIHLHPYDQALTFQLKYEVHIRQLPECQRRLVVSNPKSFQHQVVREFLHPNPGDSKQVS